MNYESYIPTFRGSFAGQWFYGRLAEFDVRESVLVDSNNNGMLTKVETDTLSISTGLKDANGKMIYDGDILDFKGNRVLVYWNTECFQWQIRYLNDCYWARDNGYNDLGWVAAEIPILGTMSTKIIGNKWDNPSWIPEESKQEKQPF